MEVEVAETPGRLRRAALETVSAHGLAAASARAIAARAGVNQALIFYHFRTVNELIAAASDDAVEATLQSYQQRFDQACSVGDLLGISDQLRQQEHANGNVAFMAQLVAGAQRDPVLGAAARRAVDAWTRPVREVLQRILGDSPLAEVFDYESLAGLIVVSFIGLELCEAVDPSGPASRLSALEDIGLLLDRINSLGPVASTAIRHAVRAGRKAPTGPPGTSGSDTVT
jgi:AcrR family transcriptional regulator